MAKQLIILAIIILNAFGVCSQTNNHATIDNLKVAYKPVQTTGQSLNTNIKVVPYATITLKQNVNANKIYFKILNTETNNVIYQINYSLSSAPVINPEGIKLFANNNGVISISNGQEMQLKPYKYQLETEDSNGNKTAVFSVIK